MKKLFIMCIVFVLSYCSTKKETNIEKGNYRTTFKNIKNNVNISLDVDEYVSLLSIGEEFSIDSIVSIQKYAMYQIGDTIKLSSEFKDNEHVYLLRLNQNKDLVISSIPNTKDSLLFGFNLKEIILRKEIQEVN